jgi:hypothetical protein
VTARDLLELLDELGCEWRYVHTRIELVLDPRIDEVLRGAHVNLQIEVPVGFVPSERVRALQDQLERR